MGGIVSAIFSGPPKAPDPNPGLQAQAQASEKVGLEMAEIARQTLAWNKERQGKLDATTALVVDQQMRIADTQEAQSKDYADYMKETFRPVEKEIVRRAIEYSAPEEGDRMAGVARADVAQQFDTQRGTLSRDLSRFGFDPTRFAAINATLASNEAAASAGAQTNARVQARTIGDAKLNDAAALGRGLPNSQATSAGIALTAGNSAVGNSATAENVNNAGNANARAWMQGGAGAIGQAGSLYGQEYGQRLSAYQTAMSGYNSTMQAIGTAAGFALG
jgi:hypothetical protein